MEFARELLTFSGTVTGHAEGEGDGNGDGRVLRVALFFGVEILKQVKWD